MDGMMTMMVFTIVGYVFNIYILLLFVRLFLKNSERYDAALGMVYRATDPLVMPLVHTVRIQNPHLATLLVMGAAILIKGFLFHSVSSSLQNFADVLLQVYVFTFIVLSAVYEFYVNPIANFGQRMVSPVRLVVSRFTQQRSTRDVVAVVGLIVVHTLLTILLRKFMFRDALVSSLALVLDLTWWFTLAIVINTFLSWLSPDPLNPVVQLIGLISAPIVDPVRRFVPPVGGVIDLSPMIAVFALMLLNELGLNILRFL